MKLDPIRKSLASLAFVAMATAGCAHVNDPFKDSSAMIDAEMTTASAEGFRGKTEFNEAICRTEQATVLWHGNGAVSHWPLWFEDPFEDKGNEIGSSDDRDAPDNHFALSWVDYLHILYGPARMSLNLGCFPVSAVVTPPGTLMDSDGRIDKGLVWYDHDAHRADSATREPPDVSIVAPHRYGAHTESEAKSGA